MGEVLVRVRACGVNHVDLLVRKDLPSLKISFPFSSGVDIAGDVSAIGRRTNALAVGTGVLVNPGVSCGRCAHCLSARDYLCERYQLIGEHLPGGYAELVRVPAHRLVRFAEQTSWEVAACLPAAFGTAWNMIFETAKLGRRGKGC